MSLIDLILNKQNILISLGIVLFPLAIAAVLTIAPILKDIFSNLRQSLMQRVQQAQVNSRKRQNRRSQAKSRAERSSRKEAAAPTADMTTFEPIIEEEEPEAVETEEEQVSRKGAPAAEAEEIADENEEPEEADSQEEETKSGSSDESNSSIQGILDSVFDDEERLQKFEILLDQTEKIEIQELAVLCDEVAAEFKGAPAANMKERHAK